MPKTIMEFASLTRYWAGHGCFFARSAQSLNRMLYPLSLWGDRKHPAKPITA